MKKRRRQCKCLLLMALYSLLLLLLPCLLQHSGWWQSSLAQQQQMEPPGARRCPSLEGSLALWHMDPAPEQEQQGPSPQPGTPFKQHIYLHATWRTGSSFLGELFNQHRDVFYLYEPAWHMWQALYPGDAGSLQGALRDMLRSLFLCDFSVLRLYSPGSSNLSTDSIFGWSTNKVLCSPPLCPDSPHPRTQLGLMEGSECRRLCPPRSLQELEAECRRYPVVVIKEVRLLEAGLLLPLLRDPALNLRVIQLFRDPRAVHNSRLKTKQALIRESVQVMRSRHKGEPLRRLLLPLPADGLRGAAGEGLGAGHGLPRAEAFLGRALEVICEGWLQDLLLFSAPVSPLPDGVRRRYASLRYEDLVRDPGLQLARLLRFAGLSPLPELEAFALNMTRGPNYPADKPFLISARNAHQALGAWRERLSRRQVQQVEESCHGAMEVLNYQRSSSDRMGEQGGKEDSRNT